MYLCLWIKTREKKGEKENGGLTLLYFFFKKRKEKIEKSLLLSRPCTFSFRTGIGKRDLVFFFFFLLWRIQTPQDDFKLSEGNFTGFLINIQPPSRASPGHFGLANVYGLVSGCARKKKNVINTAVNDKNSWLTSCDGEAAACILRSVLGHRGMQGEENNNNKFNN